MELVLIHGMGRTPLAMRPLGARLRRNGHRIHYFGYSAARETFEQITRRLALLIRQDCAGRPYALVGHSLGGILARACLSELAGYSPVHLVMLAPPNCSPLLARRLCGNALFRLATGDCGQRLADLGFYSMLPLPAIPVTVIAGTAGPRGRWSPFGDLLNDGVVTVAETRLRGGAEPILVPALHTVIMNSRQVAHIVGAILGGAASAP